MRPRPRAPGFLTTFDRRFGGVAGVSPVGLGRWRISLPRTVAFRSPPQKLLQREARLREELVPFEVARHDLQGFIDVVRFKYRSR
jgi:hypothetical protein